MVIPYTQVCDIHIYTICISSVCHSLSHIRLCDPMDYSPPGSSFHGILQARILERVAISSSRGSSRHRDRLGLPHRRQILYRLIHQGSPYIYSFIIEFFFGCAGSWLWYVGSSFLTRAQIHSSCTGSAES